MVMFKGSASKSSKVKLRIALLIVLTTCPPVGLLMMTVGCVAITTKGVIKIMRKSEKVL
jgi:hypothetical protein